MLVGDARGMRTANWGGRWKVIRKRSGLRCDCVLVRHTWYIERVVGI